jgi:uncharacterized protein
LAKILLIVVVFALVYFIVRAYARSVAKPNPPSDASIKGNEDMVRCRHCGVHLPRSEALAAGDESFCSDEHRRLHGS